MNKKIKENWIKALKNGEYKQRSGQLKDENKFCCLGVLCDILVNKQIYDFYWKRNGFKFNNHKYSEYYVLPNEILQIVDIDSDTVKFTMSPEDYEYLVKKYDLEQINPTTSLVNLNDAGINFDDIANLIEKYL